ncbi:MAG: Alcohol dehydrogenase, zinc-binding domain protein [Bryobacterales bacterium]|jgi:NADPH2:quinone reductase|nr:Alcohol dehydrogenase, zinc-binding domain protein [Bryobacterales bacterium]
MKAIYIEQTGGPEIMRLSDRPTPDLGKDEVLVKVAASGVNFTDLNQRSGTNKIPIPAVLGSEGAGIVERSESTSFKPGDYVAWCMMRGSYAEYAAVPARMLVRIPDGIDFRTAAAAMLQGMTAHYLSHATFPLKSGHTALIHAAAGGTGRLLVQMAAMLGARVIGTVGTPAKADLAREAGASHTILYDKEDWVAEVKRLTGGTGVDVVYDSVGQATFLKGLDCLKPRGMMVHFGVSSGQIEPFDTRGLSSRGSLFLARPTLNSHISEPQELAWRSRDVFHWIAQRKLRLRIDREYPLADAAQAHRDLEARKTTGKLILVVA